MGRYAIGFDFGTESVRALVVDVRSGRIAGQAAHGYAHGVLDATLPGNGATLPADFALQHPVDWLASAGAACPAALKQGDVDPADVVGIGVDFTSCTMLPALRDGTPVCLDRRFAGVPLAWPKLWKHHAAKAETDRINAIARERQEPWLARYGGTIGLEWFFPKVLETLRNAPQVYEATEVWLEAGDWLVWQLVDGPYPRCDAARLIRSTCQAGYKAMWNAATGFPSAAYFRAVDERMEDIGTSRMPGTMRAPGEAAGVLTEAAAELLGLRPGIPVSTAIIDAHAGVPGAGVAAPSTLVMVIGTSSCHMLNSRTELLAPGIAGVVKNGILPGYYGYETGQASVGDAFAWLAQTVNLSHDTLSERAAKLPPGSDGVIALDWLNGCRTPLMDGRLSGAFAGITLGTRAEHLYRALMEATAFGVRWIADTLREAGSVSGFGRGAPGVVDQSPARTSNTPGAPHPEPAHDSTPGQASAAREDDGADAEPGVFVRRFVASGGLPAKSPLLMQVYADVLGERITVAASDQSVALGAAILGALAAGPQGTGHASMSQAIHAMAPQDNAIAYRPDLTARKQYAKLYPLYRKLAAGDGMVAEVMRELRVVSTTR